MRQHEFINETSDQATRMIQQMMKQGYGARAIVHYVANLLTKQGDDFGNVVKHVLHLYRKISGQDITEDVEINELVTRADTIDHLMARAEKVAGILDQWADKPLLFREFRHDLKFATLIAKVTNDRAEYVARNGSNSRQAEVLQALGIKKPVFCTMRTPHLGASVFGKGNVVIPPVNGRMVWSPVVEDLGGNRIVGANAANYGHINKGGGLYQSPGPDRMVGKEFASTYVVGWPPTHTDNEIIIDCDEYYLLDLGEFLLNFAGKEASTMPPNPRNRHSPQTLDKSKFDAKFKNYGSIAWYLRNTLPKYLSWYKTRYPSVT